MKFITALEMPLVYDIPFISGIFETFNTFVMKTTLICASPLVCHKACYKLLFKSHRIRGFYFLQWLTISNIAFCSLAP